MYVILALKAESPQSGLRSNFSTDVIWDTYTSVEIGTKLLLCKEQM